MAVEVRLPAFEGPLDLLLHLIEKNQVDIYDIPIYEITQQYLACLDEWNKKNMEIASEFIVMAATLINIKAKMLLPVQKEEENEEDPRDELIRRLLEYKRYKEASAEFRAMMPNPQHLWLYRSREVVQLPPQIPPISKLLAGVTPEALYDLYSRAVKSQRESIDPLRSTFRSVAKDSYTIEEKIQDLMSTLEALQTVSFYSLREKSKSRQEEITYFLAMLELNRSSLVYLEQEKQFADIIMSPRRDDEPPKVTQAEEQLEISEIEEVEEIEEVKEVEEIEEAEESEEIEEVEEAEEVEEIEEVEEAEEIEEAEKIEEIEEAEAPEEFEDFEDLEILEEMKSLDELPSDIESSEAVIEEEIEGEGQEDEPGNSGESEPKKE